ncbi:hypothetical protein Lal_00014154 [Lupinus albus]|nr:hypothetical protein Lal_00014154 [Lupinus albus]
MTNIVLCGGMRKDPKVGGGVVCVYVLHQSKPKESHLVGFKRIMKYLKCVTYVGLRYPKGKVCVLVGYSSLYFVGCKTEKKKWWNLSHTWSCKKLACVPLSTMETEYIAAGSCYTHVMWLKQNLCDYGLNLKCITIRCDNTSAINFTKKPINAI